MPLLVLTALVLTACGTASSALRDENPEQVVEVVGRGAVMRASPDADVELCTGPMLTSYPPQCAGPTLLGEFSWDDVESQEHAGVRWTDWYVAVGHYDRAANTFTLTRPLSLEPPAGFSFPEPDPVDFPQLCDDPFRGGDPDVEDPDLRIQSAFQEHLETLPGYVESWVSDGDRMFNVVVTGDAAEAHAELRRVWPGGLCVEQRHGPSNRDLQAASDALGEHAEQLGLVGWGPGRGRLAVEAVLADESTVDRIREIVRPWLTAEDLDITSVFLPLEPLD